MKMCHKQSVLANSVFDEAPPSVALWIGGRGRQEGVISTSCLLKFSSRATCRCSDRTRSWRDGGVGWDSWWRLKGVGEGLEGEGRGGAVKSLQEGFSCLAG